MAPPDSPNTLRVQDAFEQVIDLFDLTVAGADGESADVIWRLVTVTMQSPLTVTAEAISARPGVNVDAVARAQKQNLVRNFSSLRSGKGIPSAWREGRANRAAKSFLARNRRQVGTTKVIINERQAPADRDEEIEITQADAEAGTITFESATYAGPLIKPKAEQVGSVEGTFLNVGTHYNKPAILIRERKTGEELWCVISEDHEREIAGLASFEDVWRGHRIAVSGRIGYDERGKICRVTATGIRLVGGSSIDLTEIQDKDFTGGLTSAEYLERLREGQLGG